jgi:hypothetical protein
LWASQKRGGYNSSLSLSKLLKNLKNPIFQEITGLFAILVFLDLILFPGEYGFREVQRIAINPFVLLILLTVIRYGTIWGYYAAVLSAAYLVITPPLTLNHFLGFFPEIALFFILLLVFGRVHDAMAKKIRDLGIEADEGKKKYRQLNEQYEVLSFLKENYEKKILMRPTTMADLYKDAEKMQALDVNALHEEIVRVVIKYVEAQKASLYWVDGKWLKLKHAEGYRDYETKPRGQIDVEEEPYHTVIEQGEVVSINEGDLKEALINRSPLYMGPMKDLEGNVRGILSVDSLSMLKFNPISRKTFSMICDWASKAIENALSYEISESRRIIDPELGVYRPHYFLMRLEEALINAKKTGAEFTYLSIEVLKWNEVIEKHQIPTLKFIARILGQHLRDFDILALTDRKQEFQILMAQIAEGSLKEFFEEVSGEMLTINLKPFNDKETLRIRVSYRRDLAKTNSVEDLVASVRGPDVPHIILPDAQ